jgi:hypothetical protein
MTDPRKLLRSLRSKLSLTQRRVILILMAPALCALWLNDSARMHWFESYDRAALGLAMLAVFFVTVWLMPTSDEVKEHPWPLEVRIIFYGLALAMLIGTFIFADFLKR